jgi:putative membrane protein
MKRAILVCAAAAAALSISACQKKEATDAASTATDTAAGAVNATQDAASAAVGAVAAAAGAVSTEQFVTDAGQGGMYEIEAGKLAQSKGQSADVKAFGKMMVTDHTKLANELKPLVAAAGKTAPAALDERHKGLIDNLKAAAPADFDKTYLDQQEAAHKETLDLMKGYADHGDDAGLKDAATKAVPTVQAHLDKVTALKAAMK